MAADNVPWLQHHFPIADFGVPEDARELWEFAGVVAEAVRYGEHVMVHCAGGIGRTGMFACAVLRQLGLSADEAQTRVLSAGSHPETPSQLALVRGAIEHL